MKKRVVTIVCCSLFLTVPAICLGASGLYGSVGAGVIWIADADTTETDGITTVNYDTEFGAGYGVGLALGYMMENIRFEGEVSYQKSDIDNFVYMGVTYPAEAEISSTAFMINGYYDFTNDTSWSTYITAGIGVTNVNIENSAIGEDADDTVFAYQIGAGIGYALNETVTLDCGYRYRGAANPEFGWSGGITTEAEVASHNLIVGFRILFN